MQLSRISIAALVLLLLAGAAAHATLLFVDGSLAADCTASYDPIARTCGSGTYRAYRTVSGAADVAASGDTVVFRAGTYNEQLAPKHSGTAAVPVIYSNAGSEQVIITGAALAPAIWIYRLDYIIVQGLIVKDVQRWLAVLGSHHITIRSNIFSNANDAGGSSKTGLFFQGSDYNVIRDNVVDNSTQDNLALVQSNHNLVEGNRIMRAAHTLWTIKCGNYNVLRRNYFHNEYQKIGEIYDCDGVGYGDFGFPKLTSLDDTKHNVVENNVFALTSTPVDASPYAGIQHAGQHCIIRGNIFYHCIGPPVDLTLYADEAKYNYGNRIYSNVFYDNGFGGASVSGVQDAGYVFADNVFRNNVFHRNHFVRHDTRWEWYTTLSGKPVQIITGRATDVKFEGNDLFDTAPGELWIVAYGNRTSSSNPAPQPLAWWESNHPAMFAGNLEADPMFTDTAALNFHPKPGSPLIDAGIFPAHTVGAGSGTTMALDAADYFRDGFGIAGLAGDTIQLQGGTGRATIVAVDYAANSVTLDTPLVWAGGEGVSLKFNGTAPDIGAFEAAAAIGAAPNAQPAGAMILFPNPTTGICTVTFPGDGSSARSVRVIDMYGRVVRAMPRTALAGRRSCAIDLSGEPSGAYIMLIETAGGIISRLCVHQ